MRRRSLLASTALLAPAAGCFASDGSPSEIDDPTTPLPVTELEPSETDPPLSLFTDDLGVEDAADATPETIVRVGDADGSHWVVAMGDTDADDAIETAVSITRSDADDPLYETTVDLSRSAYAAVNLRARDRYAIAFEWRGHREVVTVPERDVDCNDSTDAALLAPYGEAAIVEETELAECT